MASQTQRPRTNTEAVSVCTSKTERGSHTFKIRDYSQHCGDGSKGCISSSTFTVGGHVWRIGYYPDGDGSGDYVGVYLELMGDHLVKVRLMYSFSLVDQDTCTPSSIFSSPVVNTAESTSTLGTDRFMKKSELKSSAYLKDDCLVIECNVTVMKESQLTVIPSYFDVKVPDSTLPGDLGKLLEWGEGVDITFKVKREVFRAHKIVLAARSPVFKEQIYGATRDNKRMENRTIEGMEPSVFKELLHFIYTDSLPSADNQNGNENEEMVKFLIAAADRYKMERMKLKCASFLSRRLDVENVTTTIALAHEHQCKELIDTCIKYIISSRDTMDGVFASPGYQTLRKNYPTVALEIREKAHDKYVFTVAMRQVSGDAQPIYDEDEDNEQH